MDFFFKGRVKQVGIVLLTLLEWKHLISISVLVIEEFISKYLRKQTASKKINDTMKFVCVFGF